MIEHPLLDKLRAVNQEIAQRFPSKSDPGLGGVGLILTPKLAYGGYENTPRNSRSFAHTGGEGVHFSLLGRPNQIKEASPVIVTIPAAFEHPNFIVGEDLFDFLCFGIYRGFFALEQLGDNFEEAFTAYTDPSWQPSKRRHFSVGYVLDDRQRAILDLLIERFRLVPWQEPREKFDRLQATYLGRLEVPPQSDFTAIYMRRGLHARVRSLADLRKHLAQRLGFACNVNDLPDGPRITLEGRKTDIAITVDEARYPTEARLQIRFADDSALAELLVQAFERLNWGLYFPEEDE